MEADQFRTPVSTGTYGNASVEVSKKTLVDAQIADVVDFIELPAGYQVTDLDAFNDALNSSTTMSYGYRYKDPTNGSAVPAYFLAAATSATLAKRSSTARPITFDYPVIITGTLGGAAADGDVIVSIKGKFRGSM